MNVVNCEKEAQRHRGRRVESIVIIKAVNINSHH